MSLQILEVTFLLELIFGLWKGFPKTLKRMWFAVAFASHFNCSHAASQFVVRKATNFKWARWPTTRLWIRSPGRHSTWSCFQGGWCGKKPIESVPVSDEHWTVHRTSQSMCHLYSLCSLLSSCSSSLPHSYESLPEFLFCSVWLSIINSKQCVSSIQIPLRSESDDIVALFGKRLFSFFSLCRRVKV